MNTKNNPTTKGYIVDVIHTICTAHPTTQAIYLYGTWGTEHQRAGSDLDIAVLLPRAAAQAVDFWAWCQLSVEVASAAKVARADLINLRCVDTSFQAEILRTGRLIQCADDEVQLGFETLVLSMYQRLNEERAEIRKEIIKSGRVLSQ